MNTPRPYDIAFLLGYPEISGGTNVIMEHALGLTRLGHNVSIVTEQRFDPKRLAWKPGASDLPLLCHADCRGRVFDVVFATWWRSAFDLGHVPARRYAYFCQSIESRFFNADRPDMKALAEYTYRQPIPVITEATWIKRHLEHLYERDVTLVLNGIDKQAFCAGGPAAEPRPGPARPIRVLVEGPLNVPFKRVELALQLCHQAGMTDIWLLTSTPCQSYPGVTRLFSQVPVNRVGEVYRSCDVLVKLSTVEGMFGPPLEMFHCGGTAITTDVTGYDEYMQHGRNGVVVRRGHETEVIDYLRALDRDRHFLSALKAGALATAHTWPTWEESSRGFEAFCAKVIERPVSQDVVNYDATRQLKAALRLAAPLQQALCDDFSGWEMLRRVRQRVDQRLQREARELKQRAQRALRRDNPRPAGAASSPNAASNGAAHAGPSPLPAPARPAPRPAFALDTAAASNGVLRPPPAHTPPARLAFLLASPEQQLHVPAPTAALTTLCLDAREGLSPRAAAALARFAPDAVFIFEPERLPLDAFAALPASATILGWTSRAPRPALLHALRERFPLPATPASAPSAAPRGVLHLDAGAVPSLLTAGVNTFGAFLLPADDAALACDRSLAAWERRRTPVAFVGPVHNAAAAYVRELSRVPGFALLDDLSDARALRDALLDTRVIAHAPDPEEPGADAPRVVRHALAGCAVVTTRQSVDYAFMPDEHVAHARDPHECRLLVERLLATPDDQDVLRRQAFARADCFHAAPCYLEMLSRLADPAAHAPVAMIAPQAAAAPEPTSTPASMIEAAPAPVTEVAPA